MKTGLQVGPGPINRKEKEEGTAPEGKVNTSTDQYTMSWDPRGRNKRAVRRLEDVSLTTPQTG